MPRPPSRRAFTIVEVLVVVGIVTLLLGIVLPALSGVRTRAYKSQEMNSLRMVGLAWIAYAAHHDDEVLPGYLGTSVQQDWDVTFRYPDGDRILPAPDYLPEAENISGPWPWRLMTFLPNGPQHLIGYRHDYDGETVAAQDYALDVSVRPAFGYNGLFVGGWRTTPDHLWYGVAEDAETERRVNVVSRSMSSIRRPESLLAFASSALRMPGVYDYNAGRDDEAGTHVILPPIVGEDVVWGLPLVHATGSAGSGSEMNDVRSLGYQEGGDPFAIELYGNEQFADNAAPG